MKYLLITLEYPPFHGGVGNYYANLVAHWPEAELDIMTNDNRQLVDNDWLISWLPGLINLGYRIKKHGYNYILVGHVLPLGTIAWALSHLFNFRYAVFLHGYDLSCATQTPRKLWLTKQILSKSRRIIVANSRTTAEVKQLLPSQAWHKVAMVNPGVNTKQQPYDEMVIRELKKKYNLLGRNIFLSIGRLVKRKGFDIVIKAMAETIVVNPKLAYVIIGRGPEEANCRALINELKLGESIKLLTEVEDEEKMHWLQLCDVFVMVSRDQVGDYEGFGIVYLEAGLYGKPVIAGKGGGVTDAVVDNETGLFVEPDNVGELSVAMLKLTEYEGLRRRLGDAGRARAIKDFNWEKQTQKIFNLISKS